ncbi:MAG: epimerase [Congregibacter sp.]|nr:epimerase [Congregibacter sp.]
MQQKTIAIVGFGDLGERLSSLLFAPKWRCYGLRRTAGAVPAGVEGIAVDLQDARSRRVRERLQPEVLVIALSPEDRSAAGYHAGFADAMAAVVAGLGQHRPERAFFVSSTRVYAEVNGAWVNEDSATAGQDPHVMAILSAERQFLDAIDAGVVLRAGGLYGQGPGPLLKRVAAGKLTPAAPLRYANRIHRDDVAGFMAFGLEDRARLAAPIINLVDDAPVPLQETEAWLCAQLGQAYEPPALDSAPNDIAHKRITNAWLHASGYTLQYPDYRAGYGAVLQRWMAHSEREDGLDLH